MSQAGVVTFNIVAFGKSNEISLKIEIIMVFKYVIPRCGIFGLLSITIDNHRCYPRMFTMRKYNIITL